MVHFLGYWRSQGLPLALGSLEPHQLSQIQPSPTAKATAKPHRLSASFFLP
jgi:hypothetical protein